MPRYDYACTECGHVEEHSVSIIERDDVFWCSRCRGAMERQPSAPSVHFKGSGFYATDYKEKK